MDLRPRLLLMLLTCVVARARADEGAIQAAVRAFFHADSVGERLELVQRIQSDPAYDRGHLSRWLHAANLFPALPPGRHELTVDLCGGGTRAILLRIPKDYDPHKPWPLIYALHGSGGNSDWAIGYLERILGTDVDQYVVAAPQSYGDLIVHQAEWPPTGEHPAALLRIKQTVHVDSDRVYLTGYSLGGHTSWTLAVLYADQFAGVIPLAGTFTLLLPDLLWESFLPNIAHLPILCVWGRQDTTYGGERVSPEGGIAGVNRALRDLLVRRNLPATMIELPNAGHRDVVPPPDELRRLLTRRREHWPRHVDHTFRHICQAQAYWLEGHAWAGQQWTNNRRTIRLRQGENPLSDSDFDQAVARTYRDLLGRLTGEIDGQEIRVSRKRVKELTVWFGDGMTDWNRPVVLTIGGERAFEGLLHPDLFVALSQAARTWDFDRLRWAGLRFRSGGRTAPVGPDTRFPKPTDLLSSAREQ